MKKREIFKIEGDKINRLRKHCPKCGEGIYLAEHKDRLSCGSCGYTEFKGGGKKIPDKKPEEIKEPIKEEEKPEAKPEVQTIPEEKPEGEKPEDQPILEEESPDEGQPSEEPSKVEVVEPEKIEEKPIEETPVEEEKPKEILPETETPPNLKPIKESTKEQEETAEPLSHDSTEPEEKDNVDAGPEYERYAVDAVWIFERGQLGGIPGLVNLFRLSCFFGRITFYQGIYEGDDSERRHRREGESPYRSQEHRKELCMRQRGPVQEEDDPEEDDGGDNADADFHGEDVRPVETGTDEDLVARQVGARHARGRAEFPKNIFYHLVIGIPSFCARARIDCILQQ